MTCCSNPMWRHLVANGAITAESVQAALAEAPPPRPAAAPGPIDTVLLNGTFLLAEPSVAHEQVTAVALSGETIVDVGDAARILRAAPDARQVDLAGTTLAPGFIEAHAHIIAAIQTTTIPDLGAAKYPTIADAIAAIAAAVKSTDPGGWVFFVNFDPSLLAFDPSSGFPQLNAAVFAQIPGADAVNIFVENASSHIAYANLTAFNTCNITPDTPPPADGGYYQKDAYGQLTGVMFEPPTFEPFMKFAPKPGSLKTILKIMNGFLATAQRAGITTVADPAVGIGGNLEAELGLYALLAGDPEGATDVVGSLDLTSVYTVGGSAPSKAAQQVTPPTAPGGAGSFFGLTIPALKLWTDGTTQGYTAFLTEPYLPPVTPSGLGDHGEPDWHAADLADLLGQAHADNWSLLLHANGDAAIDMALTAVASTYGARADSGFRNRIEHCTVTRPEQYDTMLSLGVTPTYLNNHIWIWGDTLNTNVLGNPRASRLDAASEAVERGMIFSFHCDYSVSLPAPLRYMQTAVTRATSSGVVLGPQYAISPLEALKGVTIYPAIQLGLDASVGTIAAGKRANFVNLAADPLSVAPDSIAAIQVLGTWLHGTWMPVTPASQH